MSEPVHLIDAARARIPDIARAAGVSTATVDRVLNAREGVRAVTAQRVLQAAAQLGYLLSPTVPAAPASKPMRIAFLLPAGTNRYLHMLGDYIDFTHAQWNALDMKCACTMWRVSTRRNLPTVCCITDSGRMAWCSWRSNTP